MYYCVECKETAAYWVPFGSRTGWKLYCGKHAKCYSGLVAVDRSNDSDSGPRGYNRDGSRVGDDGSLQVPSRHKVRVLLAGLGVGEGA